MVSKLMIRRIVRVCSDMAKVGDAGVVGKNGVGEGPVHIVLLVSVVPLDGVQADLTIRVDIRSTVI